MYSAIPRKRFFFVKEANFEMRFHGMDNFCMGPAHFLILRVNLDTVNHISFFQRFNPFKVFLGRWGQEGRL